MDKLKKVLTRGQSTWNILLVVLIILEFAVFGGANPKFLRPALLFTSINDNLAVFILSPCALAASTFR